MVKLGNVCNGSSVYVSVAAAAQRGMAVSIRAASGFGTISSGESAGNAVTLDASRAFLRRAMDQASAWRAGYHGDDRPGGRSERKQAQHGGADHGPILARDRHRATRDEQQQRQRYHGISASINAPAANSPAKKCDRQRSRISRRKLAAQELPDQQRSSRACGKRHAGDQETDRCRDDRADAGRDTEPEPGDAGAQSVGAQRQHQRDERRDKQRNARGNRIRIGPLRAARVPTRTPRLRRRRRRRQSTMVLARSERGSSRRRCRQRAPRARGGRSCGLRSAERKRTRWLARRPLHSPRESRAR